jgi:hypothetical protein
MYLYIFIKRHHILKDISTDYSCKVLILQIQIFEIDLCMK